MFFAGSDTGKIVYAASPALDKTREKSVPSSVWLTPTTLPRGLAA